MDIEAMQPAQRMAYELFLKFKAIAVYSEDTFEPNAANLARWHWTVSEDQKAKEANSQFAPFADGRYVVPDQWNQFIALRAANTLEDMPVNTKSKYMAIASMFPGVQLYATGSRVTGEYVDTDSEPYVREMRRAIGKADKVQSDFDFTVAFEIFEQVSAEFLHLKAANPESLTLANVDLVRFQSAEKNIPIPMWNFDLLPENQHAAVIEAFQKEQWGKLADIHNTYGLSPFYYCCDLAPVRRWFEWAIQTGRISAGTAQQDNQNEQANGK